MSHTKPMRMMSDEEVVHHVQHVHPELMDGLAYAAEHMTLGVVLMVRNWHEMKHRERKYLGHAHRKG